MTLSTRQRDYLRLMGVEVWLEKGAVQDPVISASGARPGIPDGQGDSWGLLRGEVSGCEKCDLHRGRQNTVFGTGDPAADWMIIGEAPGAEEDRQGEPFVGRAGKLLNAMLEATGFQRDKVYIANILKCRPPNNRDPKPEEVRQCEGYLARQIALVQPKIILALGRVAAQNLLNVEIPIGKMRGNRYSFPGTTIPVIVTYHPAYLLRSPGEKRKSWQDLQLAMKIYRES